MYAVYAYKTAAVISEVMSDLMLLLTGTTDVNALGASCVKASSSILATEAAGWAVYDAAAGTNSQCVRALNQDGATYKYATVTIPSALILRVDGMESWNAGTHVGTNVVTGLNGTISTTAGGVLYIYCTPKNLLIFPWTSASTQMWVGVLEYPRGTVSPTTAYPCHVTIYAVSGWGAITSYAAIASRTKSTIGAGDAATSTVCVSPLAASLTNGTAHQYRDVNDTVYQVLYPIGINHSTNGAPFGQAYDIKGLGGGAINGFEEVTTGGITYVLWKYANIACSVAVPKK